MAQREESGAPRDSPGVIAPPPLIYLAGLGAGFGLEALLPSADVPDAVRWLATSRAADAGSSRAANT